jgi:hypothetical protein
MTCVVNLGVGNVIVMILRRKQTAILDLKHHGAAPANLKINM